MALQVNSAMVRNGALKGIKVTLELGKIVVPTTIVVTVLRASGVLDAVAATCAPLMGLFGLSGDAALVLISGYFVNLYAATGSILALGSHPEKSQLAIMLICPLPVGRDRREPQGWKPHSGHSFS